MEQINIALALDSPAAKSALQDAASDHNLVVALDSSPNTEAYLFGQQVALLRPQIVFLETSRLWGPLGEVVQSLRAQDPAPEIVILHPVPDPEIILDAMRAGAAEFVYPPFGPNLARALERLQHQRHGNGRTLGKTLGFLSATGGCGATTVACNIAGELRHTWAKSALLVDLDPDIGVVSFLMKTKSLYSVIDALQNAQRLDRSMWQAFVSSGPYGIDVLGAPDEPGEVVADADQSSRFFRFARTEYDVTVVDLGRGISRLNTIAMADLDATCLVTTMEIPALHRARRAIKSLLNNGHPPERLHLIVNNVPRRQEVTSTELEKMLDFPVYAALPQDEEALSAAYSDSGLVSSGTMFGKRIATLAALLIGQPEKEQKKFRLFSRTG